MHMASRSRFGCRAGKVDFLSNVYSVKVEAHAFFGSSKTDESVDDVIETLRGGRY